MCILVAAKCQIKSKKNPNSKYVLYKIRDRSYDPDMKVKVIKQNGVEALFVIDSSTQWLEGSNSEGIMIVSSALDNHSDQLGQHEESSEQDENKRLNRLKQQHKNLKMALLEKTVDGAIAILKNNLFPGHTLISDGEKLISLEIGMKPEFFESQTEIIKNELFDKGIEESKITSLKVLNIIYDRLKELSTQNRKKLYSISVNNINDDFIIRTNHGIYNKELGYGESAKQTDIKSYNSSHKRYQYTYDFLTNLYKSGYPNPFDVLYGISNLIDVDKQKQNNPIRPFEKDKYYTTGIFMLTHAGNTFILPIQMTIEPKEEKRMITKKDRKVDAIILPKKIIESIASDFSLGKYKQMLFKD